MAQLLLPDALLPKQLLNKSNCTTLLIHYYFSDVPKFEARNIFYLIGAYTEIFVHLSPHFQHIVLINFLLLTHLKNSPMNYSYHLFIPSFHILMIFLHLFIFWIPQIRLKKTSFLKHKTIKTSFLYFLILNYKFFSSKLFNFSLNYYLHSLFLYYSTSIPSCLLLFSKSPNSHKNPNFKKSRI
jgi:hypothetical protein